MRLLYSRSSWYYGESREERLDFCLWVLQVDGLCVPPFDQHPAGDGSLRAAGLTAGEWQAWFLRIIDENQNKQDLEQLRQRHLAEYLIAANEPDQEHLQRRLEAEHLNPSPKSPLPQPPEFHYLLASWKGSAAVGERLIELERQYNEQQISEQLDRIFRDLERARRKEEQRSKASLYDQLKPYYKRIPPLTICSARYAYPLDYMVKPATLFMTIQEGQPGPQEFNERVLAGVAELANWPPRRSTQKLYTNVLDGAGRVRAVYRRYERQAVPPAPMKKAVPKLEDPVRQTVLEDVTDEAYLFGSVDGTTVQFLREKHKADWHMYEISFRALDDEERLENILLQKDDDGYQRVRSSSSSSNVQSKRSEFFSPVYDHPLIFLSVSVTSDSGGYHFRAYGDVIDNGFQVARVRLSNDAGQVFEDTVEHGLIFFVSEQKDPVQLPMQAELFNNEGKLVWSQKVPDDGLPPWLKLKKGLWPPNS